jgi:hypothetical protein
MASQNAMHSSKLVCPRVIIRLRLRRSRYRLTSVRRRFLCTSSRSARVRDTPGLQAAGLMVTMVTTGCLEPWVVATEPGLLWTPGYGFPNEIMLPVVTEVVDRFKVGGTSHSPKKRSGRTRGNRRMRPFTRRTPHRTKCCLVTPRALWLCCVALSQ